jgi:hypothetical protein
VPASNAEATVSSCFVARVEIVSHIGNDFLLFLLLSRHIIKLITCQLRNTIETILPNPSDCPHLTTKRRAQRQSRRPLSNKTRRARQSNNSTRPPVKATSGDPDPTAIAKYRHPGVRGKGGRESPLCGSLACLLVRAEPVNISVVHHPSHPTKPHRIPPSRQRRRAPRLAGRVPAPLLAGTDYRGGGAWKRNAHKVRRVKRSALCRITTCPWNGTMEWVTFGSS